MKLEETPVTSTQKTLKTHYSRIVKKRLKTEKNVEGLRGKKAATYEGKHNRQSADFSAETLQGQETMERHCYNTERR